MNKKKVLTDLSQRWEDAAQRAAETTQREDEAGADVLNTAAGLRVQSGILAGDWTDSCGACTNTCTCGCPPP
ncbi:MAG TPA: hypothetical protein VFD70_17130 [Anaerolineae bacterium]|nr:hypothetical protein [Anaerolineae bacterium]